MSDLLSSAHDPFSDPSLVGIEGLLTPDPPPEPAREGLPHSFRMRADKHYVEMLDAPPARPRLEMLAVDAIETGDRSTASPAPELVDSIARYGVLQPVLVLGRHGRYRLVAGRKRLAAAIAAGLREVPGIVRNAGDDSAEAILAATNLFVDERKSADPDPVSPIRAQASTELARSLSALGACVNLLGQSAPAFTQTIATNLVRAEAWRSACLLQASRILNGEVTPVPRPVYAQAIVDRVVRSMEPERRLRGVLLEPRTNLALSRIDVDEELVVCALSALMMAVFTLADANADARVMLTAELQSGGDVLFGISQDVAGAPLEWVAHSGDGEGMSAAGGLTAVAIVATRRIIAASNGRTTVESDGSGTRVHIIVPGVS